ncbi:putative lipoprotein YerB precursor [compost metagenome]
MYEIVVEGGETRLMALFKAQDVKMIGPIRSSRHYFLDYALENDAIYVHYGWSPQAQSDISTLKVNNINGINESSSSFWRSNQKSSPHNVVTTTQKIKEIAANKGYSLKSSKKSVLNYKAENVTLDNGVDASEVVIPHSTLQTVKYTYDSDKKVYKRVARNKAQTDWESGNAITTKNIIIEMEDNYALQDTENKGRQGLDNIGTFDGYYITNGKAIKIKCEKKARNSQTIYKDLNGQEINVNDGNTWINICPKNANLSIK